MEKELMRRKVRKSGTSVVATIPPKVLEELNLQPGDDILFEKRNNGEIVLKKEKSLADYMGLDTEFMQVVNESMTEYEEALKSLVDR